MRTRGSRDSRLRDIEVLAVRTRSVQRARSKSMRGSVLDGLVELIVGT